MFGEVLNAGGARYAKDDVFRQSLGYTVGLLPHMCCHDSVEAATRETSDVVDRGSLDVIR